MLVQEDIDQLNFALKRIFSFKITRSTFREVQNALLACTGGDQQQAQALFKWLVSGEPPEVGPELPDEGPFQELVKEYAIQIRLAKEVTERGEFINLITSDTLRQGDNVGFLHRIRRVDGEELQFVTDVEGTVQLLVHVAQRLKEISGSDAGKSVLQNNKNQLDAVSQLISSLS